MKKSLLLMCILSMLLVFGGCSSETEGADRQEAPKTPTSETGDAQKSESGKSQIFECKSGTEPIDIKLEVSNVKTVRTETISYTDGSFSWDYEVYTVYPGAMVTVLDADMAEEADGERHADWVFMTASEERTDITDGMEPVEA